MNMLYKGMYKHWESYQLLQALADREATSFQAACHFIASYVSTLSVNDDPFVDQLVDREVIKKLVAEFPAAEYETRACVPPLCDFLALSQPWKVGRTDSLPELPIDTQGGEVSLSFTAGPSAPPDYESEAPAHPSEAQESDFTLRPAFPQL
jgi:hypothetical protein